MATSSETAVALRHRDLHLAECPQQRARPVAVAMTGDEGRRLRIAARPLHTPAVARARQHLIELALEHRLQEVARSIPKASFDRVEPVVEKIFLGLDFRRGTKGVVVWLVMA